MRIMKPLLCGHIFLIICCIFYLIWWCFAFRPGYEGSRISGKAGFLLLITAFFGIVGVALSITGLNQPCSRAAMIPSTIIVIGGISIYLFLMIGSSVLLHRRVTTELILIVGWLMIEFLSYQSAWYLEWLNAGITVFLMILAAAAALLSLFFYLQYYRVSESRGYVYGMVPLITEAVCMAVFVFMCEVKLPGA